MSRSEVVGYACAVGVMSGTSADGADAALVRIERGLAPRRTTLVAWKHRPFSSTLRARVLQAQEGILPMRELLALHVELGTHAALTARDAVEAKEAKGLTPEVVGSHGQTVFHDPQGKRSGVPLSIQIGEPSAVARAIGCRVVSNFRMADILEGGEGAPLVPRFDLHQFVSDASDRVLLNLGGIANLTRLKPNAQVEDVVAFDCGSGNMLLDAIMGSVGPAGSRYDDEGAEAARGTAARDVVDEFLADPFIARRPPKSAGREEFGASYLERFLARTAGLTLADRLRTAVEITAGAVARGVAQSGTGRPDEVLVSGGGAKNRTLLEALRRALPGSRVGTTEDLGVPVGAKEAMAFAFLAFETISGRPGNVPSATGARREVVLGSITPAPYPA
ncbi:MAG TPA: anhydro-N-acetylmuramic acid kinase [Candidatus Polarisedimenticolia bacterium]|nr:anhydro-N-acetylmuramic acid kinase [Candidatus Polarisedimenticolia bacterium]